MGADDPKLAIQRRRYADYLRRHQPIPADLDRLFQTCPRCSGRGHVGHAIIEDGRHIEVDDTCPRCGGNRFVSRD